MIVTDALACRLEHAEAVDAVGCVDAAGRVDPEIRAAAKGIAGGFLTFCGAESPLTHALGVGMHGPVSTEEILEIEHFFRSRGSRVAIDVCPHADPSLSEILCRRGYRITDFHNVLVRVLPAVDCDSAPSDILIRNTEPDDIELYTNTIVRGFFGRDEMTEAEQRLGQMLFRMPCATSFLACLGEDTVAGAGLSIRNRVASFFGDATLTNFRGRGAHSALISGRLRVASEAGCDLAVAGTQPGSTSQRNYQRLGFEVAYSKATMVLES